MTKAVIYEALNQLLTTFYRSLPSYLAYAVPWVGQGNEQALATVRRIADDEKQIGTRVAQYILEHHGPLEMGEYPSDYFDLHDVSLEYLIPMMIDCQKSDVATLEHCVRQVQADREVSALCEEALGAARGHLESLEELASHTLKVAAQPSTIVGHGAKDND